MEGSITQLGLGNYLINKKEKATSFFRHGYKNYQNFVKETRRLTFKGSNNFSDTMVMRLDEQASYGDLITNIVLEVDLPDVSGLTTTTGKNIRYCNGVGNAIIDSVELKIGGTTIDSQNGIWMDIWSSLAIPSGKQSNYKRMIKKIDNDVYTNDLFKGGKIYIPILFWFCQNTNYNNIPFVLPMLALRNNNIEFIVKFKSFKDVITSEDDTLPTSTLNIDSVQVLIDYVILEEPERLYYLEHPRQMYLMNQVQTQDYTIAADTTEINISLRVFKYPITELFFVFRMDTAVSKKQYFNYTNSTNTLDRTNPLKTVRLTFDGSDRVKELDSSYFTQVEPHKVHDNVPDNSQIHCFSFALQPENIAQPSGSCNFSEIHEPILHLKFKTGLVASRLFIYALNYNVLQIDKSGNAWLLHSLSKSTPSIFPDANSLTPSDCQ